jgi:hypothetical protein
MNDLTPYVISFENGSNLHIPAKSMSEAAGDGVNSLLRCFPEGYDSSAMVKPTIIRMVGDYCSLCGKALSAHISANIIGYKRKICLDCAAEVCRSYILIEDTEGSKCQSQT